MPTETRLVPPPPTTLPRSRALVALALAATLAAQTGCSSWQPLRATSPDDLVEDRPVRFHVMENAYEVKAKTKLGPLVLADVEVPGGKPEPVTVDLRLVQGAEVYAPRKGRTALIVVGSTVGGGAVFAAVIAAVLAGARSSLSWGR